MNQQQFEIIISGFICMSIGICLGVKLVSHNGKMARKLLEKAYQRDKKVRESMELISQKLAIVSIITNEKRIKDEILTIKIDVDRLTTFFI